MSSKSKIEITFQIPCGAIGVSADSVCKRGLRDSMDRLLDRLSKELHPVELPDKLPKSFKESDKQTLQGNSKLLQDVSGEIEPW